MAPRERAVSSSTTRSPLLLRKAIVVPLSPQNVQWDFAPHQHPRDVSGEPHLPQITSEAKAVLAPSTGWCPLGGPTIDGVGGAVQRAGRGMCQAFPDCSRLGDVIETTP